MKRGNSRKLAANRALCLADWDVVCLALMCQGCEIREVALQLLADLGWTEEAWKTAVRSHVCTP